MLDLGRRISIYQPEQDGLIFPEQPVFESFEQERQHRKEKTSCSLSSFCD